MSERNDELDGMDEAVICDLSQVKASPDEMDTVDPADELGLPVGWVAVTVTRRLLNPKYRDLAQAKEVMLLGLLQQLPENLPEAERRDAQRVFEVQVHATYAVLDAHPDYAPTIEETETRLIAPEERAPGNKDALKYLSGTLGFNRVLVHGKRKRKPAPAQAPSA